MLLGVFLVGEIIPVFVSCSEMGAVWQEEQTGAWEGTDSFSLSRRYQLLRRDCIPRGLGMSRTMTHLAVG